MDEELQPANKNKPQKDKKEFKFPDELIIPDELKPIVEDPDVPEETKKTIIKR